VHERKTEARSIEEILFAPVFSIVHVSAPFWLDSIPKDSGGVGVGVGVREKE